MKGKLLRVVKTTTILLSCMWMVSCSDEEWLETPPQNSTNDTSSETLSDFEREKFSKEEIERIFQEELDLKSKRVMDITGMDVAKENPKKVYIHYMPWYQSKDYDGFWGQHWTMANKNPDIIDENGQREIASHLYPLIGPYSSTDPDLQAYHFMLMKLAGIDGVIFDWYSSRSLYDYGLIHESTETFMDMLKELGMDFAIMFEDRAPVHAHQNGLADSHIEAAQEDMLYMDEFYFSEDNYIEVDGKDLLMVFGPNWITTPEEWDEVFSVLPEEEHPNLLTLWASSDRVGDHSAGEFLWVAPDHLVAHDH